MGKISDIVTLKTGYANFVELKNEFKESKDNLERMAMYRPTTAHRRAMERICRGLMQPTDKKFYLLSGSYGTGKSHLSLMLANILSKSSNDPGLHGFYDNYQALDAEKAKLLRNVRQNGQYLVAICDYNSGKKFEDVVMKAIFDACKDAQLDTSDVKTEFDEAERLLSDWKKKAEDGSGLRDYLGDFAKALEQIAPGVAVEQLRKRLQSYDSAAFDEFHNAYKLAQGGAEFQAQSGNLIPIVRKLVKSKAFRKRFVGLAIFFDEFGFTLEKAAYSKDVLQGFMETICQNESNIMFVGCIHKNFKDYSDRFGQSDFSVMTARLTQVDLLNEGIEEIIGAIVEVGKDGDAWIDEVSPKLGVLDKLVPVCEALKLFPWIPDTTKIRQCVLEDIYGVHPMALSLLLKLSSEIGSDARSTFTFFSGDVAEANGSYVKFIKDCDITGTNGALALYTPDRLFEFFEKELTPGNSELRQNQRSLVGGYFASIDAIRKSQKGDLIQDVDERQKALLRTILLYQLCRMPTTLENLCFGLYCISKAEKTNIQNNLKALEKIGAIYLRKQSKTYELAASDSVDPYDLIDQYVVSNKPDTSVDSFLKEVNDNSLKDFLPARQHNLPYNDDKRLARKYVRSTDLDETFFNTLASEMKELQEKEKQSYEGIAVYVICEDDVELRQALQVTQKNKYDFIAVAVPGSATPYKENLERVKACRHYLSPEEERNLTAQTVSRMRDMLDNSEDGYLTQLKKIAMNVADGGNSVWYGKNGAVLADKPQQSHRAADAICDHRYTKRCRLKHGDLNMVHDDKWRQGKNSALRQAVDILLSFDKRVYIDNGNPDSHGEKRYLEKVLLKSGALKKAPGSEGTVNFFTCNTDAGQLSDDFPALQELCSRMKAGSAHLRPYIKEMRTAPYGVSGTALVLTIAYVVRAFGEGLRVYTDSTKANELRLDNYQTIANLIADSSANPLFEVKAISQKQRKLLDAVAEATNAPAVAHGETRTVQSTFESLQRWFNTIPNVAKISAIYDKADTGRIEKLLSTLSHISRPDKVNLLLSMLPQVYTDSPMDAEVDDDTIKVFTQGFKKDVKLLSTGEQIVINKASDEVAKVFGGSGDIVLCEQLVNEWWNELSPQQRSALYDDDDAQSLKTVLSDDKPFNAKFATALPEAFGLDAISNWNSIQTDNLASKWKNAKKTIEDNTVVISKPDVKKEGDAEKVSAGVWVLKKTDAVILKIPDGASKLIYTIDGQDPRTTSSRQETSESLTVDVKINDGAPSTKVMARAVDSQGNVGELLNLAIVNKEKEYEISIRDDMYTPLGQFKVPEDKVGVIAVLRNVTLLGKAKKYLSDTEEAKLESVFDEIERG